MSRMQMTRKSLIRCVHTIKQDSIVGCEVGVWRGGASKILLKKFPHLFLHMVDPWHIDTNQQSKTQQDIEKAYMEAKMQTNFAIDRRNILRMVSILASKEFSDGELDFVFIDANHLYENVRDDIACWWFKVKHILIGHDYGCYMDKKGKWGIKKAVDEFAKKHNLEVKIYPGYIWSISK